MKTQKGMQTLITNWTKRTSKKFDADCLVDFENKDNRSFYFKYDGTGEFYSRLIEGFDRIFQGTGWNYDYDEASVMVVYKED